MNIEELIKIRDAYKPKLDKRMDRRPLTKDDTRKISIMMCRGSGCIASAGEENLYEIFDRVTKEWNLQDKVEVVPTGCQGLCEKGPLVVIHPGGTLYTCVQSKDIEEIIQKHVLLLLVI